MTPDEAKQLYTASTFASIKSDADTNYLNGLSTAATCLDTSSPWVQTMGTALEELSGVYLALKWGKYNGSTASELDSYRNRLVSNWKQVIAAGPIAQWTDNYDPVTNSVVNTSSCVYSAAYKPGWYEGDIALRFWIFGALPSYDAIRDDISSTDRNAIDAWLDGLASTLWSSHDFPIYHNRGTSALAQAHLIALLLQDGDRFNTYFGDTVNGLKDFHQYLNYTPLPQCIFPVQPGFTNELSYRDGTHGVQPIMHGLGALASISHAAHSGGDLTWDIANTATPDNLYQILDSWYGIENTQRAEFESYVACLEASSGATPTFKDSTLDERLWAPMAYLQPRFLSVTSWGLGSLRLLRKERASLHSRNRAMSQIPTISVTSPTANQSYVAPANITLSVNAAIANGSIGKVEYWRNGSLAATSYTAPYSATLAAQPTGTYSFFARIYDTSGNGLSSGTTTVNVVDPSSLAVYLKTPVTNAYYTAGENIQFNAIATSSNSTIAQVEFYNGSTYLGKDKSAPYYYTWDSVPAGTYTITARAIGSAGETITSSPVTITVGPANQAPYASLVNPTDGSTIEATSQLALQTDASDSNNNLSRVEYYQGGVKLGSNSTSPYSFNWKGVPAGSYSLTARAYDSAGASYTSTPVALNVELPESWQHQDVGYFNLPGSTANDGSTDTWTVKAAGSDIWGTNDSFRYVYQPLSGDGSLVARLSSFTNTSGWAKAGVMIREELTSSSRNAMIALTPENGATFQYRTTSGGGSASVQSAGKQAPYWIKLERQGNTLRGYTSSNGSQWTLLGSCTIDLAEQISIGFAVTSHNSAALTTAVFTDVAFTP